MPFYRIRELKLPLDRDESELPERASAVLRTDRRNLRNIAIERKSFDARDKSAIKIVYSVRIETEVPVKGSGRARGFESASAPVRYRFPEGGRLPETRPIVVGSGPAGLFCALLLAEHGFRPLVLERGEAVDERVDTVRKFFAGGDLDPESNVQFGEGGAGTFSDGKLTTSVSDPMGRNAKVLEEFVEAGAPPEILFLGKPHIGTDLLVGVVRHLRRKIEALGGELRFKSRVTSLTALDGAVRGVTVGGAERIEADAVILAIGHSARDTFEELLREGIALEAKAFAIGLRIEHPQEMISRAQFGDYWSHPALSVADYRLARVLADGRGAYTFCVCPGGYVVNASSENGSVACNGMSDFARNARNANGAVVVTVGPADFGSGPLAGLAFQRRWEALAYRAGGGDFALPVQALGDFFRGTGSQRLGEVIPSAKGPYRLSDLNPCLPPYVAAGIKEAVLAFERKLAGFSRPDAVLTGVETRTSSPVRITRTDDLESGIAGLFPCGEGAGYSGGIMSSAIDGIRAAEAVALSATRRPGIRR
jgi:uncharacterized FAD-dependent dehydrogenase